MGCKGENFKVHTIKV